LAPRNNNEKHQVIKNYETVGEHDFDSDCAIEVNDTLENHEAKLEEKSDHERGWEYVLGEKLYDIVLFSDKLGRCKS